MASLSRCNSSLAPLNKDSSSLHTAHFSMNLCAGSDQSHLSSCSLVSEVPKLLILATYWRGGEVMAELRSASSMCSCIYSAGKFVEPFRRAKRCLKKPCFDILPDVGASKVHVYRNRDPRYFKLLSLVRLIRILTWIAMIRTGRLICATPKYAAFNTQVGSTT